MAVTSDAAKGFAAPKEAPSRRWLFGPAVLDERSLELSVRGEVVSVEPKALEVLLHLLHHAGEVVTKNELFDAVWPGRVITEGAVTRTVGRLREAIGDVDQTIIRTVHGHGWRLVAPVQVEAVAARTVPRFEFAAGESPRHRPDWELMDCLGRGGRGEVWLARHRQSHEARVLKFAYDATALASLKREITLNRLLRDTLGEDVACVKILGWNLEEPPYFIEAEHVRGGSLDTWAERGRGLLHLSLAERIEIAAQIADALAAAHSVGVLHKDLKPANVLVDVAEGDGTPHIKLTDFGSGGVLDPDRLDALGITRLGFTHTVAQAEINSGTPLYLAPEVLAGQPATVKADLYALGVILYQLAIGDLRKPLAPGWERDIEDESLREDIAEAAAGDIAHRITDAAQLAQRLRTLEERGARRVADRELQAKNERASLAVERYRARRGWVRATIASLAVGLAASIALSAYAFRTRQEALDARDAARASQLMAEASAATAQAVSGFLNRDLLAKADPRSGFSRDATLKSVMDRTAAEIDERFKTQPATAAQLHVTLAEAYYWHTEWRLSGIEATKALDLYISIGEAESEGAIRASDFKARAVMLIGGGPIKANPAFDEAVRVGTASLGAQHPAVLYAALFRAFSRSLSEHADVAGAELQWILDEAVEARVPDVQLADTYEAVANGLVHLSDYRQAEQVLNEGIRFTTSRFGTQSFQWLQLQIRLGVVFVLTGRFEESGRVLGNAKTLAADLLKENSRFRVGLDGYLAWARFGEGKTLESLALVPSLIQNIKSDVGADTMEVAFHVFAKALMLQRMGRLDNAEQAAREAADIALRKMGPTACWTIRMQAGLADILRQRGRRDEAWQIVRDARPDALLRMQPVPHEGVGSLRYAEGRLLLDEGRFAESQAALEDALRIWEARGVRDTMFTVKDARESLDQARRAHTPQRKA